MLDVLRDVPLTGDRLYVWGAGERRAMTTIRRHLRTTLGLPRSRVSLVAYWRHATRVDDEVPEQK